MSIWQASWLLGQAEHGSSVMLLPAVLFAQHTPDSAEETTMKKRRKTRPGFELPSAEEMRRRLELFDGLGNRHLESGVDGFPSALHFSGIGETPK
jgi:hypothetical protein